MAISVDVDTKEFRAKLQEYMKFTRKTLPEALNHRAVNIAFRAIRYTPSAKKGSVGAKLRQGSHIKPSVPLAAIMVQKYLGNKNKRYSQSYKSFDTKHGSKPIPPAAKDFKQRMEAAVTDLINMRNWSRGFIKAGWLGAIRAMSAYHRVKRKGPKSVKAGPKALRLGKARVAVESFSPKAIIENYVPGAVKMGATALSRAMKDDVRDMSNYIIRKLKGKAEAGDKSYKRYAKQSATSKHVRSVISGWSRYR